MVCEIQKDDQYKKRLHIARFCYRQIVQAIDELKKDYEIDCMYPPYIIVDNEEQFFEDELKDERDPTRPFPRRKSSKASWLS